MQKNSVNKVILVGRLGQKPELRYTPSQAAVTNVTLATNETRRDAQGNTSDQTEWHRVVIFGKTAEFVANYLDKGALVYIDGRLQTRSWEDKDGIKRYTTEIIALTVTPLGGRSGGSPKEDYSGNNSGNTGGGAGNFPAPDDEEPLPF